MVLKNFKWLKLLIILVFLLKVSCTLPAAAKNSQIILFYTCWHAKTAKAQNVCKKLAALYGIELKQMDIDRLYIQKEIRNAGLDIPSSIPFIYIIDSKGRPVYKKRYVNESAREIKCKIRHLL